MATRPVRVKVDRQNLITALERKQNQCRAAFAKNNTDPELYKRVEKWKRDSLAILDRASKEAAATAAKLRKRSVKQLIKDREDGHSYGKDINGYLSRASLEYMPKRDASDPRERATSYGNIIRMLRLSKEASVSLTEDQFALYMDGCPL